MKQPSKIPAFKASRRANGFTLIELLVVIAIIAILAALLLPALVSVKNRSQMVTDISNNKQIMLAVIMYANNTDDYMPQPGWNMGVKNWASDANLPLSAQTKASYDALYGPQANGSIPTQIQYFRKGQLYPYLQSEKLLRCPLDIENANMYLRRQYLSTYIWNGGVVRYGNSGGRTMKLNAPELKGTYILQWENDEMKTATGQWNDLSNYPDEGISKRHGDGATVATLDGAALRMDMRDFFKLAGTYPTGNPPNPGDPRSGANYTGNDNTATVPNELWWYPP